MKELKDFVLEYKTAKEFEISLDDVDVNVLKDAAFGSSFMDDRSWVKIDGTAYEKIKQDGWQNTSGGSEHVLHGILSSRELFNIISRAKEVELHLMQ